jgi:CHASE3 domain sensor protein
VRRVVRSLKTTESSGKWAQVAALVLVVLLVAAATRNNSQVVQPTAGAEARNTAAYARITQLAAVLVAATNAETCSRGYVITGDAGFLAPFARALEVQSEALGALQELYADDRERAALLRDVRDAVAAQQEHMSGAVARRRVLGTAQAGPLLAEFRGRDLTDSLRAAVNMLLIDEQSGLARDRVVLASATSAGTRRSLAYMAAGLVALALAATWMIRERRRAAENIYGVPLAPELDGRTER